MPSQPEAMALVLVPLEGAAGVAAAQAAGLTLYGRYGGPGGEFLLAGAALEAGQAEPAVAIPVRVLDRDTAGGTYYLAMMPPGVAGPDWAAYGRVLLDDGAQVLLRTTPGDAERLVEAGAEIVQLTLAPMVVVPEGVGVLAARAAIAPDPRIQGMLDQVITTTVTSYEAQLTGEQPLVLSDGPYTITTRYTDSGMPIQKALQFVEEHLVGLGYSVENHAWSKAGYSNVNVIGERTGTTNPSDIYIIGAHLDSVPSSGAAPGADDNASGSVAVLIAADILSQYQWGCTLRFALWTGEEQGLLGSSVYAARSKTNGENVKAYLNLDMVAYNAVPPQSMTLYWNSTVPASQNIADLFVDVVSAYDLALVPFKLDAMIFPTGRSSDQTSFWDQGYAAIYMHEDNYSPDGNPNYHQSTDTMSALDMGYLTTMVKAAVGTFAHMSGCLIEPVPTTCQLRSGCRTAEKSTLLLRKKSGALDTLAWKWTKGEATSQAEFGHPVNSADYALCVYAGTAADVVTELKVAADTAKWSEIMGTGYKYRDRDGASAGVQKIILKGSTEHQAMALVKGAGANLPNPMLGSIPAPVTVQLVNSDTAVCWEAVYDASDVIKNEPDQFKARTTTP